MKEMTTMRVVTKAGVTTTVAVVVVAVAAAETIVVLAVPEMRGERGRAPRREKWGEEK